MSRLLRDLGSEWRWRTWPLRMAIGKVVCRVRGEHRWGPWMIYSCGGTTFGREAIVSRGEIGEIRSCLRCNGDSQYRNVEFRESRRQYADEERW